MSKRTYTGSPKQCAEIYLTTKSSLKVMAENVGELWDFLYETGNASDQAFDSLLNSSINFK